MIRLAKIEDLKEVMEVINDAKILFRNDGSDQWQDTDNYPDTIHLQKDIEKQELYVNVKNNLIVGCIVLSSNIEEAYNRIYDGSWYNNDFYMVIHRIAVRNNYYNMGIAKEMMEYVIVVAKNNNAKSIKVDTKIENIRMINLLNYFGFKKVGKIDLLRKDVLDKVRIALELVL